ncbi:transporter substrate-binding protein [Roseiconus lacunae]|uniref:transporter substrate-binding protein n=1 Tax=Roseiconus lacunae TaxID=2605694 RepID=UPI001E37872D|nr:transporter substrate-binding protein [Roseiconus lacunae]MCD0460226.1 transporter substrate-binding protein [Roseiconus lacunae]
MTPNDNPSIGSPTPDDQGEQPQLSETRSLCTTSGDAGSSSHRNQTAEKWIGKTLGKYEITGVLGQGGMGLVLRAHDPTLERDVAIKVLSEHLAANPTALARFQSEAKAAGKLNHANVASIHEIAEDKQLHYLVMELLAGGSVAAEIQRRNAYTSQEATRIMIDACGGIAAAHAAGLVHRDIKPANLVRSDLGTVKITDFGLAKLTSGGAGMQLTQSGTIIGTPYFMSPEQCQGQSVDSRTDIYALGATYYCLLTGREPYDDSDSAVQVMFAHCHKRIPNPRDHDPSVPPDCSAIISRAMAKDPCDRYQTVEEMLHDLQGVDTALSGHPSADFQTRSSVSLAAAPPSNSLRSDRRMYGKIMPLAIVLVVALGIAWSFFPSASAPIGPHGEPIKVGVLQSLSGTMSRSGTSVVDATLLAIEEINLAGGLMGRPVKAVVADGRSDTQTYAREAERLIKDDNVCVVFGCWTSATRKTVRPIFEEHNHLLIYPVQYEGMETCPNIVYIGAAPNQQILPAVSWANEQVHVKRFFLVGSDYVFPRTASQIIKDQMKELDAEVIGERFVPLGSLEFSEVVKEIKRLKPDMILNTVVGDSNVGFFNALRDAGIGPSEIPCLMFSIGEQELRSFNIQDVEGDYAASTYFQSLDSQANQEFVERFTKKYPQHVISDPMENAYVGVKLWAQAVRDAESIEPAKVRRAMLNQRLAAPEGDVRVDPETQHCFKTPRVGQIQSDGQFRVVWSAEAPIRPSPYPLSRTAEDWKAFLHDLYTGWGNNWTSPTSL